MTDNASEARRGEKGTGEQRHGDAGGYLGEHRISRTLVKHTAGAPRGRAFCRGAFKTNAGAFDFRTQGALTTKISENYHRRRCHQYGGYRATMPPCRCAACHQEPRDRTARPRTVHQLEYRGNSPNVTVEHNCRRYSGQ